MSWFQVIMRRGFAAMLVLALTLLLAPAAPVAAGPSDPTPLPGYPVTGSSPGAPEVYQYPSASALANLPEPNTIDLQELNPNAKWGSKDHLFKKWIAYRDGRTPSMGHAPSWEDYRDGYIRIYDNFQRGREFERIARALGYFANDDNGWRFNMRLPGGVNRRPDAMNRPEMWAEGRNWIWDFKTGSIDRGQLKDFIRYAIKNNLRLGFLFDHPPELATIQGVNDVAAEVAREEGLEHPPEIEFRHVNLVPSPNPAGSGVLAAGDQTPVNGGLGQTIDNSPDSPEHVVADAYIAELMQPEMEAEEQNPASTPGQAPASAPAHAPGAPAQQPGQAPASAPAHAPGAPAQQPGVPAQAPAAPPAQAPAPPPAQPPRAPAQVPRGAPAQPPVVAAPAPPAVGLPALPLPNPGPLVGAVVDPLAAAAAAAVGASVGMALNGTAGLVPSITGGLTNTIGSGAAVPLRGLVGGVDFSTLELRYISDTDYNGSGVRYAFAANTQPGDAPSFGGRANAFAASDAFFVWLALPPSAFTVNLNPNEPDRIIDAQFGRTEAGRILLEADLTMKQSTAKFIDPAIPDGRRFLDALQGSKCFSPQRKWIIPLPASVHQEGDAMYILDTPLDVKLEILNTDLKPGIGCPAQDPGITGKNDELYRTMILPKVVDAVNHAAEFADLRRVYASRVAAEWYRQRSATKTTAYSKIVNSGNIDSWTSKQPWSPQEVFARYRKSFYDGDATYTWMTDERTTWKTTIGGVDFTNIPFADVTPADFVKAHPTLPASAKDSLFAPRFENSGQQVWLGGLTSARPMSEVWKGDPSLWVPVLRSLFGASLSPLMYAVITLPLAAWVGVGGVLWWRRRRAASFVGGD
jgi:hypothetical protein